MDSGLTSTILPSLAPAVNANAERNLDEEKRVYRILQWINKQAVGVQCTFLTAT